MLRRAPPLARSHPMIWSSLGLISAKGALMGLGFLFWLFAARRFPARDVGLTAGASTPNSIIGTVVERLDRFSRGE